MSGPHRSTARPWPELDESDDGSGVALHHLLLDLRGIELGDIGGRERGFGFLAPFSPRVVLLVVEHVVQLVGDVDLALSGEGKMGICRRKEEEEKESGDGLEGHGEERIKGGMMHFQSRVSFLEMKCVLGFELVILLLPLCMG